MVDYRLIVMNTQCRVGPNKYPWQYGDDLVRFLQIMFHAKKADISSSQAASPFGERNLVIVMKVFVRAANDTAPAISAPDLNLNMRWNKAVVRQFFNAAQEFPFDRA
jgi:hypothetical protein